MSTTPSYPLTLFYDGTCPLCKMEMAHLMKRNKDHKLLFQDIYEPDFSQRFPQFDVDALNARIHAQFADGHVITGLDVTYQAWKAVGKGWLYAPTRWPVIRTLADWFYVKFADNRYTISYWLTGQKRSCDSGQCRR